MTVSIDRTLEDTFYLAFTTRNTSGVPTTLSGTPVVSAYEDNSLTQITAGITLGVDHDSVTGLNLLTIVATAANGYEKGKDYNLVITTGTVGGTSVVGEVVGHFSLSLSAAAKDLDNGTDGLGAIKTDTAAILVDTADMQPKLGTPAGASISADIATVDSNVDAILVDTADMQPKVAKIPLSDGTITWNATALASINAECDTALADYDGPTNAEMNARTILSANYATASALATVDTNVDAILVDTGTTIPATLGTPAGASMSADTAAVKAETALIVADTNELQTDWADGGRLDLILDARAAEATVAGLNDLSAAQVNAEVLDVLNVDTFAEKASVPAATSSLVDKITWVFMNVRNKTTQTSTTYTLMADDTTTPVATRAVSDDGTTASSGEAT